MCTQKENEIRALEAVISTLSNELIAARRAQDVSLATEIIEALSDKEEELRNRRLLP